MVGALRDKKTMLIKSHDFTAAALSHFRELQCTSFTILEETAASPAGGETKKEVTHALVKRYRVAGADSFFHLPVVLFSGYLVDTSYIFCFGDNDEHPGEVLGHRAVKTPNLPFQLRLQGFDAVSLSWFRLKDRLATSGLGRQSPLWNSLKTSDHKAHDGLWLVEPHAGLSLVGADYRPRASSA